MTSSPPSPFEEMPLVLPNPAWGAWCQLLPEFIFPDRTSPCFRFHALIRNDRNAMPLAAYLPHGVHGLRHPNFAIIVRDTLELAYQQFLSDGRSPPKLVLDGKIPVYLFAVDDPGVDCGSPQMFELYFEGYGLVPMIALASRNTEPNRKTEIAQACASAVHELSHVFNATVLPYRRIGELGEIPPPIELLEAWLWLDEAFALDAEMELLPNVDDWMRYSLDWVDRPDRSLDHPDARYQAAFFIRYLRQRIGSLANQFFADLWRKSSDVWDAPDPNSAPVALTALAETWPAFLPGFSSAVEADFFASGFCYDSYFLDRPGATSEDRRILQRFGNRAIARTWRLPNATGESVTSAHFSLAGLACHYLRFMPTSSQPSRLSVRLRADLPQTLKAEFVAVGGDGQQIGERSVAAREPDGEGETLHVELAEFSSQHCDHAILVVTNCSFGTEGSGSKVVTGFRQQTKFDLTAELSAVELKPAH